MASPRGFSLREASPDNPQWTLGIMPPARVVSGMGGPDDSCRPLAGPGCLMDGNAPPHGNRASFEASLAQCGEWPPGQLAGGAGSLGKEALCCPELPQSQDYPREDTEQLPTHGLWHLEPVFCMGFAALSPKEASAPVPSYSSWAFMGTHG